MNGFHLSEAGHLVPLLSPLSISAAKTCQRFNMKGWHHASILVMLGNNSAVPGTIVVKYCTDSSGSGATAIGYRYYKQESTPSGDVLTGPTTAASTGIVPTQMNNSMYVIELDSPELADGSPWVEISFGAGATSCVIAAAAVLSAGRHAYNASPTVLS